MADTDNSGGVVAILDDMIFESKIRSTAQSLGVDLAIVKSLDDLSTAIDRNTPRLLLIDLNMETSGVNVGLNAVSTAVHHSARPYVVAFVSHVDRDLSQKAEAAGADKVLPRSRFVGELADLLKLRTIP